MGTERASPKELLEPLQRFVLPFGVDLHGVVGAVADPPDQVKGASGPQGGRAETDPLHPTVDERVDTLHGWAEAEKGGLPQRLTADLR